MKKQTIIYFLGILIILVTVSLMFVSNTGTTEEVSEQRSSSASWNALTAGSFIFN